MCKCNAVADAEEEGIRTCSPLLDENLPYFLYKNSILLILSPPFKHKSNVLPPTLRKNSGTTTDAMMTLDSNEHGVHILYTDYD